MSEQKQYSHEAAIAAVIDYWFADIGDGFDVSQQYKRWFSGGADVDREIAERFGDLVRDGLRELLSHWAETARGTLALILVLDQFTRNVYRGSARAFAGDDLARQVLYRALAQGHDRPLNLVQRSFFYMPLQHSESLADQQRSVELFQQLLDEAPEQGKALLSSNLDYALQHRDIIVRFGRFPHRNAVLSRAPTSDEQAYLSDGGARFGQ